MRMGIKERIGPIHGINIGISSTNSEMGPINSLKIIYRSGLSLQLTFNVYLTLDFHF